MKPITAYAAIRASSRAFRGPLRKGSRPSNPTRSSTPCSINPFKASSTRPTRRQNEKFRAARSGISGFSTTCHGAPCGGAGVDIRMGTIHRKAGTHDRHENIWSIYTAKRTPEKIRLRAGPSGSGCKRIAREELAWSRVGLRIFRCDQERPLNWKRIPSQDQTVTQETKVGRSSPLGATLSPEGTNFSVYSKHATAVELLLFDRVDDARPARVIRIDPASSRTYHYWHVFVPGVNAGQIYSYRVEGAFDPPSGMRFDPAKVLIDPYARGVVVPKNYSRDAARKKRDNAASAIKSVVADTRTYDWEGDTPLNRPSSQTIVYEMHVRGFTRDPSSGVAEKKR